MFSYEFVNLNATQVEIRRQRLDEAGYHAYLAPILILTTIYLFRKTVPSPSSYDAKSATTQSNPGQLTLLRRRIAWLLDTTYIGEFGPLQVQVLGLLYMIFLLCRITYQTGNDYMHVTRAFGHVAVSQLPLHYLLAIKSPYSPITIATGLTHERLNAYHRLFGRIVHVLLATHAAMYLYFFVAMDLLTKRIKDTDVRLGVLAFWTVNFIGIVSIPPIRARAYHKVFYRSHVLLSAALLGLLWFHVKDTRVYVAQAAVVWVLNGVLRTGASQSAKVKCEVKSKNVFGITAEVRGRHLHPYLPGVHVYLNQGGLGPRTPFTVLSARGLDQGVSQIELVAKNSGGPMTGWLGEIAEAGKEKTVDLQLEGPYGEAQRYMPQLLADKGKQQQKVLLVAGGVGATYALPIFKSLAESRGSAKSLKLVWAVRSVQDLTWAQDFQQNPLLTSSFEIGVTRMTASDQGMLTKYKKQGLVVTTKRPDFDTIVDNFLNTKAESDTSTKGTSSGLQKDHNPVVVMACGPAGLSKSVRKSVGRHVLEYGRDITWWEEQFGFGGSVA